MADNIKDIEARWVLDSRGWPTVEADVSLDSGATGRASVPSGASTGSAEAVELRDGGKAFLGKGVSRARNNILTKIRPSLTGLAASDQAAVDKKLIELDGSNDKHVLGANAALAVSLAVSKAAAGSQNKPYWRYISELSGGRPSLPMPMANLINGGAHADFATDVQEFMIVPVGIEVFSERVRAISEIYQRLKQLVRDHDWGVGVGDEGGFIVGAGGSNETALTLLVEAITKAGYEPKRDIALALDVAATGLYSDGNYKIDGQSKTSQAVIDWLADLASGFPLISIEDGLAEDDWPAWQQLNERLGGQVMVVGDDLLVTNVERLGRAIEQKAANTLLVKPNQVGTLTETLAAMSAANKAGWKCIVSHRSGETEDTTIAHLAVGTGCGWIKTGAPARGERTAKYNELLRIEERMT